MGAERAQAHLARLACLGGGIELGSLLIMRLIIAVRAHKLLLASVD